MASAPETAAAAATATPVPAKGRRRRRPDEVRARVLVAALDAFSLAGFEGASLRSIASNAGVSLSLLLYHFGSKDELWRAVLQDIEQHYSLGRSGMVNQPGLTAAERLRHAIHEIVRRCVEKPQLHRFITLEGSRPSARLAWMCDHMVGQNFKFFCGLIAEAQAEGAVRQVDPERLRYAIYAMAAVPFAQAAEYEYLTQRNPFSASEIDRSRQIIEALVFI